MKTTDYKIEESLEETDINYLQDKMNEYNKNLIPPENPRIICYFIKNSEDCIIGGILGETKWRQVHIYTLWIDEKYRKEGLGRKLINALEEKAKNYDCIYSMVGTFEALGARPFYERLGYTIVSRSENSPDGHTGYFFYKLI